MLKIGTLKLKSNLILAPMAGITDLPFRSLNRRFGCELAFTEMINVRSVSYRSKKTQQMLSSGPRDKPLGVQLLGKEEKYILKALDVIRAYKFDLLDFNAACPARKVTRRGEGASLLKEPEQLKKLLKLLVEYSSLAVTVKIRIGWDKHSQNCRETALLAEDVGAKALFIHGRTKADEYGGRVDYQAVREAKKAVKIPVIASGNVLSPFLAKKMLDETGCDGLLVARGALGNPWIFEEIKAFLKDGVIIPRPGKEEIARVMLEHLDAYISFYGERSGVVIFRKFFAGYTKAFRRVRHLREASSKAKTREGMVEVIQKIPG